MTFSSLNLLAILPEILLLAAALVVLLGDLLIKDKRVLGWFSVFAVTGAFLTALVLRPAVPAVQNMILADGLGRFASLAVLVAAALAILLSIPRVGDFTRRVGPYYALVLLATAGMTTLCIASDFMTIFLGVEILSIALYILVGFCRGDIYSGEAALKYFLLGAFASGFFLYGIALIYGATATTNLAALAQSILPMSSSLPFAPLLPIGVGLLLVGFGFKLALVPFHKWTPDVYQGAPTPITAYMSVATKMAVFAALIRVLGALPTHQQPWLLVLAALAVLTMTLGNIAALRQTSLKRMLAYSSIAQAGYVLIGLAAGTQAGAQAALYYLAAYTFMNLGAFAVVLAVQQPDRNDVTRQDIVGLAGRQPMLAALMAVFMFALTGIPPLAGFFGKLYVFGSAVDAGLTWLAVVGVINSAIAAYYYLRVTVEMFMTERIPAVASGSAAPKPARTSGGGDPAHEAGTPAEPPRRNGADTSEQPRIAWPVWAVLAATAAGTLALGLWQSPLIQSISQAVTSLALLP
jgi:NADH-quinone oxidoreductase subunit N